MHVYLRTDNRHELTLPQGADTDPHPQKSKCSPSDHMNLKPSEMGSTNMKCEKSGYTSYWKVSDTNMLNSETGAAFSLAQYPFGNKVHFLMIDKNAIGDTISETITLSGGYRKSFGGEIEKVSGNVHCAPGKGDSLPHGNDQGIVLYESCDKILNPGYYQHTHEHLLYGNFTPAIESGHVTTVTMSRHEALQLLCSMYTPTSWEELGFNNTDGLDNFTRAFKQELPPVRQGFQIQQALLNRLKNTNPDHRIVTQGQTDADRQLARSSIVKKINGKLIKALSASRITTLKFNSILRSYLNTIKYLKNLPSTSDLIKTLRSLQALDGKGTASNTEKLIFLIKNIKQELISKHPFTEEDFTTIDQHIKHHLKTIYGDKSLDAENNIERELQTSIAQQHSGAASTSSTHNNKKRKKPHSRDAREANRTPDNRNNFFTAGSKTLAVKRNKKYKKPNTHHEDDVHSQNCTR